MEVLVRKDYLLIPDHTYSIYGVDKLIDSFCKNNQLQYSVYSLKELKKSIQANQLTEDLREFLIHNIALFLVPVSNNIKKNLYNLFNKKILSFGTAATGMDHVDFDFLQELKIPFFDAQGENKDSVVEYVLSVLPYVIDTKKLLNRTIRFGVIGYGRIGKLLVNILEKLGFSYVLVDPYVLSEEYKVQLSRISGCDVITFHVPLTYTGEFSTYQMIDKIYLNHLNNHQIIINTSRGKIFSPESYRFLVNQNQCVFDVYYEEPPKKELLIFDNLKISTPHVAGYNWISRFRSVFTVLEKFARHFNYRFNFIIDDFLPKHYETEIYESILKETHRLKSDPNYFSIRDKYPTRADIKNQTYKKDWNLFHKELYELFRSIDSMNL